MYSNRMFPASALAAALAVAAACTSTVSAQTRNDTAGSNAPPAMQPRSNMNAPGQTPRVSRDEAKAGPEHVAKAVKVVQRMEQDPGMRKLLSQARGVFIVPDYGRAALGIGGRGGAGVLMVRQGGTWSDKPTFFNFGGVSVGVQAGAEGGAIAFVLNDDKAVKSFLTQDNNWSLNADAGLTVVNWSKKAQGSAGKGDVTVWADSKGLLGDLAVSLTDINFDEAETSAFYDHNVKTAGAVMNADYSNPHAAALQQALASAAAGGGNATASAAGASGSTGTANHAASGTASTGYGADNASASATAPTSATGPATSATGRASTTANTAAPAAGSGSQRP